MDTGINVGTTVDPDSLDAVTKAVVTILDCKADQKTLRHALDTLGRMSRIENVNISNVNLNGDRTIRIDAADHTVEEG